MLRNNKEQALNKLISLAVVCAQCQPANALPQHTDRDDHRPCHVMSKPSLKCQLCRPDLSGYNCDHCYLLVTRVHKQWKCVAAV